MNKNNSNSCKIKISLFRNKMYGYLDVFDFYFVFESKRISIIKSRTSFKGGSYKWIDFNCVFKKNFTILFDKKSFNKNQYSEPQILTIKKMIEEFNKSTVFYDEINKMFSLKTNKIVLVDNLLSFINEIISMSSSKKNELKDWNIYYRGLTSCWDLKPSIFFKNKNADLKIIKEKEINFFEKFNLRFKGELKGLNNVECLALMRHHKLPCRIMDVTQNPLVSLFFACLENDDYSLGKVVAIKVHNDDSFTTNDERVKEIKICNTKLMNDSPIHVDVPRNSDARIAAQEGSFIISDDNYEVLKAGSIETIKEIFICNKESIKKELELFCINEANLFPDMDHYSKYLMDLLCKD